MLWKSQQFQNNHFEWAIQCRVFASDAKSICGQYYFASSFYVLRINRIIGSICVLATFYYCSIFYCYSICFAALFATLSIHRVAAFLSFSLMQIRWVSIRWMTILISHKIKLITIHLIDETNNKTINILMMPSIIFFHVIYMNAHTHTHRFQLRHKMMAWLTTQKLCYTK